MAPKYTDLRSFHSALAEARIERDRIATRISERAELLHDRTTRGALMRDAAGDVLRSWGPYRHLSDLFNGNTGTDLRSAAGVAGAVTSLYAATRPTFLKRLIIGAAGKMMSKASGRSEGEGTAVLMGLVARGIRSLMRYREERRTEKEAAAGTL